MTKIQRYCYFALGLLAVLYFSTAVSLAQRITESRSTTLSNIESSAIREPSGRTESIVQLPIDPFAVLPAADALILVDLKRFISDALPRLLVDEQDARALVMALPNQKPIELLDPLRIQRVVIGLRYSKPQDEKSSSDFEVVTVVHSGEAIRLAAIIRSRGPVNTGNNNTPGSLSISRSQNRLNQRGRRRLLRVRTNPNGPSWRLTQILSFSVSQPTCAQASI